MSHFVVVVIGEDHDAQLAPYHEFECTGRVDKYVQSIDQIDEARKEYQSGARKMVILSDGEKVPAYDDRFYRVPTEEESAKIGSLGGSGGGQGITWHSQDWGDGEGYSSRVRDVASIVGAVEAELPYVDLMTFREFVEYEHERLEIGPGEEPDLEDKHKWGWVEIDASGDVVKVIQRTNPNSHWDWYLVGGRWTGYFPLRTGTIGEHGKPGLMTPSPKLRTADQCRWGDVDFTRSQDEAEAEAAEAFDLWEQCFQKQKSEHGTLPFSFAEAREKSKSEDGKTDLDAARTLYREQPAILDLNARLKARGKHGYFGSPVLDYGFSREDHLEYRRSKALVPFAVVKDGVWYQKGEMGWWTNVSNAVDESEWVRQVAALFEGLPEDTLVTAIDCHT